MIFLTRSDIAKRLNVSLTHAGNLMKTMPRVQLGKRQYRVAESDFTDWVNRRKLEATEDVSSWENQPQPKSAALRGKAPTLPRQTPVLKRRPIPTLSD